MPPTTRMRPVEEPFRAIRLLATLAVMVIALGPGPFAAASDRERALTGAAGEPAAPAGRPMHPSHVIHAPWRPPDELYNARQLAVGPDGNVYVRDDDGQRIVVYGPDGAYRNQIGGLGREEGRLLGPVGMAIAPDGTVYVADHADQASGYVEVSRVQRFSPGGRYLGDWWPADLKPADYNVFYLDAVGPDGTVFLVDVAHDGPVIRRYRPSGEPLPAWTSAGPDGPRFADYLVVDVDRQGHVIVGDRGAVKVHVLAPDGTLIASWGTRGSEPGRFSDMAQVAAGPDGSVFTLESGPVYRVQHFTADGRYLGSVGEVTTGDFGFFTAADDVAIAQDGSPFLLFQGPGKVVRFSAAGAVVASWGHFANAVALEERRVFDADERGNLVVGAFEDILLLDPYGSLRATATLTDVLGFPENLQAVAATPDGGAFVLGDLDVGRVDAAGRPMGQPWPAPSMYPCDMAAAPDGTVYIADNEHREVLHHDAQGNVLHRWGGFDPAKDGQFASVIRIDVAPDGSVFTLDYDGILGAGGPARSGRRRVDGPGIRPSRRHPPAGNPPDRQSVVAPVQSAPGPRLQHFGADGRHLGTWQVAATARSIVEELNGAQDLAIRPDGTILVSLVARTGRYSMPIVLSATADGGYLDTWSPSLLATFDEENGPWLPLAAGGELAFIPAYRRIVAYTSSDAADWSATYFPDSSRSTWPAAERLPGPNLARDWGTNPPAADLPADGFVARFERFMVAAGGLMRFHLAADGGARVWVGARSLVDQWDADRVDETRDIFLSAGPVLVAVEYTDPGGAAGVSLTTEALRPIVSRLALPFMVSGWY